MRITIKATTLLVAIIFMSHSSLCAEGDDAERFQTSARIAREVWRQLALPREAAPARQALEQLRSLPKTNGFHTIAWETARVAQSVVGHDVEAELGAAIATATAPECVIILLQQNSTSPEKHLFYADCLSRVLPASVWRVQIDSRQSVVRSDIKPPRPESFVRDRKAMVEIAESLQRAGLYDLAWRAFAEAVYAGFSPPWTGRDLAETWSATETGTHWRSAAECARLAGKKEVAWDYLMKAAIVGTDADFNEAMTVAAQWVVEDKPNAAPKAIPQVDSQVKADNLTRAARLYVRLNMHPRALELIHANRDTFNKPDELYNEIEGLWAEVVKKMSIEVDKLTLYGVEVYPKENWRNVKIPLALTDAGLDYVTKQITPVRPVQKP